MNQITGTIQNIFSDRPLQEDEYRNESDNLIHCAKCKTPRQHHVVVLGKEMVVPIRCRCQQEVQDKEEAEKPTAYRTSPCGNTPLPMIRVTTRKCRKPMTMLSIGAK